jgi:hypothetical protein
MQAARRRDLIARQYANGYRDVFGLGISRAREARVRWGAEEWTAAAVYLGFLACFPDTHIVRKYGRRVAQAVQTEALELDCALMNSPRPELLTCELLAWDARLKAAGYNPGSCADLTVATLFALSIQEMLSVRAAASSSPEPNSFTDCEDYSSPKKEGGTRALPPPSEASAGLKSAECGFEARFRSTVYEAH